MQAIGGTLARYFGLRFLAATIGIFAGILALSAVIDYVELMRRASDVPNASPGLIARIALFRLPQLGGRWLIGVARHVARERVRGALEVLAKPVEDRRKVEDAGTSIEAVLVRVADEPPRLIVELAVESGRAVCLGSQHGAALRGTDDREVDARLGELLAEDRVLDVVERERAVPELGGDERASEGGTGQQAVQAGWSLPSASRWRHSSHLTTFGLNLSHSNLGISNGHTISQ